MATPLLETKFHVPRRHALVTRPRLSEQLTKGIQSSLTLVSAPAGFGKTTLLADWLEVGAADGVCVAWLSLDERDSDLARFWTYLVTALSKATDGAGTTALSLLQSPPVLIEPILGSLLNDLNSVVGEVVLVLDDFHLLDTPEIDEGMAFLLDHLPEQLHVVIVSRADPSLPLARLRARGELVEIRAADLRFTPDEAAQYLNEVMGLTLTSNDVAALEARTEGWIAALQLAALSMQGRDDVTNFIAGFAGDDRFIVDYLAEEVLARQADEVRDFLLRTSILDRLSGPLCDAVIGHGGGKAQLAALDRSNLFLVPLDDRRQWYRYHQLFADVLQAHLLDEQPGVAPQLHLRASEWFERSGEVGEAIRHALRAPDFDRAADLIETALPAMQQLRQEAAIYALLTKLPEDLVRTRPKLCIGLLGALFSSSAELDGLDNRRADAERWLEITAGLPEDIGTVDVELRRIPGMVEVYRAAVALAGGDAPGAVEHAHLALALLPNEDNLGRAAAAGFVGLTAWASGDLKAAHQAWSDCRNGLQCAGSIADTLGVSVALADIRITQGRLSDAMTTYQSALRLAAAQDGVVLRGTPDMHVGIADLLRERNDLAGAAQQLLRSQELGEHVGLPQNRYRERAVMARLREAEGDLDGALALFDEAQLVYTGDYFPNVRPVAAMKARLLIKRGELSRAQSWAGEAGLSGAVDLHYMREFEHITLARLLLAQRDGDDAAGLLNRLLNAAEGDGRTGSVIEILVLQALAGEKTLERALTLAEPEGYVRIFIDEGPAMTVLLKSAPKRGAVANYARRILIAAEATKESPPNQQQLIEPLSERELDVLRLLGSELDGPEIARELFVSLNTMRTHTKSIYAKLGVSSRRAAVRRGQELGL